jgi:hypothetical protein
VAPGVWTSFLGVMAGMLALSAWTVSGRVTGRVRPQVGPARVNKGVRRSSNPTGEGARCTLSLGTVRPQGCIKLG